MSDHVIVHILCTEYPPIFTSLGIYILHRMIGLTKVTEHTNRFYLFTLLTTSFGALFLVVTEIPVKQSPTLLIGLRK